MKYRTRIVLVAIGIVVAVSTTVLCYELYERQRIASELERRKEAMLKPPPVPTNMTVDEVMAMARDHFRNKGNKSAYEILPPRFDSSKGEWRVPVTGSSNVVGDHFSVIIDDERREIVQILQGY